jgi:hypothetical protein
VTRLFDAGSEQLTQIGTKAAQELQSFWRRLHHFAFGLKDLTSSRLDQHSDSLSQAPARRSKHLQAIRRWYKESNTAVANHAYALGKTIEGLKIKTSEINTLKLFGWVRHGKLLASGY